MFGSVAARPSRPQRWLVDARRVDLAIYGAVAATPTPTLDAGMSRLSHAADKSRLWMSAATVLAVAGGRPGRRAAVRGLVSVAVSSAVVNLGIKQVARRRRPDREAALVPQVRHVPMPISLSFPSGHAASAFAFATGVGSGLAPAAVPLHALAAGVAYSRVHTGVHYPGDVVVGALVGTVTAQLTTHLLDRYVVRLA